MPVPYNFDCVKEAGFIMDPNEHKRVGYVTSLDGFGLQSALTKDLKVFVPFGAGKLPNYQDLGYTVGKQGLGEASVIGVIEKFGWNGGVGDAIEVDFWVSQENAVQIKTMQQRTLSTTKVSALGWWICDFDQEQKVWYEQAYPKLNGAKDTITGIIAGKANPELNVDLNGAPVKDGIDVLVYKVSMQIAPGANQQYALNFATAAAKPVVKQWGLVVGTLAGASFG
jgi:hypothetical protein